MTDKKNAIEETIETIVTNPYDKEHRDRRPPQTVDAEPTSDDAPEQTRRD